MSKETCEFTVGEHELGTGSVVTYIYDKDKLIKVGSENSTFDAVGNPTLYRGKSAVWTRGRKLVKLSNNLFEYDSQGKRIKKNTITYIYDSQNRLIQQSNGLEFFYDTIGLLGFSYNGNYYYYRMDVQGNVIAILDSNGNVVVQYEYDAWGNHTLSGSNLELGKINPFRYRSYYFDTETKLYFLQTRYYDPEVGRFINIDSIEYADPETINGLNLYAYCLNNPVKFIDPTGKFVFTTAMIIGLIIGAVVGAVVGGYIAGSIASENGATGCELFGWTLLGVVGGGLIGGAIGTFAGWAAPAIGSFLGTSFKLGSFMLATGETITVSVTGGQAIAGLVGLNILFARIGKSGGYIIDHHYPNDHDPIHVHISGDDGFTKVDLNGNPIQGNRKMTKGERKAFEKLYPKILKALFPWIG